MIGIIEIILDKKYKINLIKAFDFYFKEFFKDRKLNQEELKNAFINFADTRFKNFMLTSGYKSDEIAAALNSSIRENFYTEFIKIDFLSKYKENEAVFELSQIYKRINNITYKFSGITVFNEEKLTLHEEKQLISVFQKASEDIILPLKQNDFKTVLSEMHKLVMPVNVFFDGVMILAEQEEIKNSRIGLLNNILNLLKNFCDFSSLDL
jgi:glycyl-tRNA synthetase beta chain